MFKFNFNSSDFDVNGHNLLREDTAEADTWNPVNFTEIQESGSSLLVTLEPSREIFLDNLIHALPPIITFSTLDVPLSKEIDRARSDSRIRDKIKLFRRDLFDARFQVISLESEDSSEVPEDVVDVEEFVNNPSDLIPGVYEGGLKTWECSLDLISYLESTVSSTRNRCDWIGKKIFEIGCGTAMPTIYILHEMFSSVATSPCRDSTTFYLQDYNNYVLELVTFPNILLTWYFSPLSEEFRTSNRDNASDELANDTDELQITDGLLTAFRKSLKEHNIFLRFFCGSWDGLYNLTSTESFDTILTSETIYRQSSLLSLIELLRNASGNKTSLGQSTCLVCAKVLYFGVGGGILEFEQLVKDKGGRSETVFESKYGVRRRILAVKW